MRKTLTVLLLGASWAVLGGCEQEGVEDLEPAAGLPQNEAPRAEPDVQIGSSDTVDPVEPVEPASPGADLGDDLEAGDIGDTEEPL